MARPFHDFFRERAEWQDSSACRWLFRKAAIGRLRFLPGLRLAEDGDFVFRFLLRARRGIRLEGVLYYYARTPGSAVNCPFSSEDLEAEEVLLRHLCEAFRGHPRELARLRRTFLLKQLKVTRKALRALGHAQGAAGSLVALGRAREARYFAEGILSLRDLPLRWALRLLPAWVRGHWFGRRGAPVVRMP